MMILLSLLLGDIMKNTTISISLKKSLLEEIDEVARKESRTRSDLIRDAVRLYIERKKRWKDIFAFGKNQVKRLGLKEKDVEKSITQYRKMRRRGQG